VEEASVRKRVAALFLGLAVLTACGGSETPPAESPTPADEPSPQATGAAVQSAESDLGTILTDAEGRTLYYFLADTGSESTCYDDCAQNWPALSTEGDPQAGTGVDASLLATTTRTDGSVQITYNGKPLYYFAGDETPGDTNGQGVGDVWFVVSPQGEPIQP
jgi:predicted lipoprotein with Yx(FWY)xxD motif